MAEVRPRLSVVIPTCNRRESVIRVLEALDAQDISSDAFEVIVVLNGCEDDSAEALSRLSVGFPLRTVELQIANAAIARNTGAKAALGSVLVFVDDDIEATQGFLAAHERAHAGDDRKVVIGYSKPHIPGPGFFDVQRRAWWEGVFSWMNLPGHRYSYRDLLSGNFSIRKQTFDALGGFEESLDCREDYELGLRCLEAGLPFVYAPDAIGLHRDISNFARSFVRARREGEADAIIARRRPEAFPHLLSPPPPPAGWIRRAEVFFRLTGGKPEAGVVSAGMQLLSLLERWRFRNAWLRVVGALRAYCYGQGVRSVAGAPPTLPRPGRLKEDLPTYDLADGLDAVRRRLDAEQPSGATFVHGAEMVVKVPADRASERLAGRHLTRLLQDSPRSLAFSYAARDVLGPLPKTPATLVVDLPRRKSGISIGEVDVGDWSFNPPLADLTFPARLVVRRGQSLFGWVHLYPGEDTDTCLYWVREAVIAQVWPAILRRAVEDSLPAPAEPISGGVSVVVCTRDRLQNLKRCLAAIEGLQDPEFEVVVVDNAPSTSATEDYVRQLPWVRYVREDRPGLDWARNRGVAAARFPIIAFTDDDTKVDRHWLSGIRRAFAQEEVAAVTGLVAPMKLDTYAQIYFEDVYGGMGKGFEPRWRRRALISEYELLWSSICGVGANMAFRRSIFDAVGGFDPGLDVGTPTRGGGDIEFFHRLIANGHTLVYEPSAMIWHEHRTEWAALRGQLRDNGSGFMAYLLACRRAGTVSSASLWRFVLWSWGCRWLLARLIKPGRHRRQLVLAEMSGALAGPSAHSKARRQAGALAAATEGATEPGFAGGF